MVYGEEYKHGSKEYFRIMVIFLSKVLQASIRKGVEAFVFLFEKYLWEAHGLIRSEAILGE